jgi:hypothetical protein
MLRVLPVLLPVLLLVAVAVSCDDADGGAGDGPSVITSTISIEKRGDGPATVTTTPNGLVCDIFCESDEDTYEDVESVDVVIEPSRDAQFIRAFCLATGQQTISANVVDGAGRARLTLPTVVDGAGVDWDCVAEHRLVHTLQVIVATGSGTGRVRGTLASSLTDETQKRIDCPGDCVGGYFVGEVETLEAVADPGSTFVRWNFCSDDVTTSIDVLMDDDQNCEAIFDLQ